MDFLVLNFRKFRSHDSTHDQPRWPPSASCSDHRCFRVSAKPRIPIGSEGPLNQGKTSISSLILPKGRGTAHSRIADDPKHPIKDYTNASAAALKEAECQCLVRSIFETSEGGVKYDAKISPIPSRGIRRCAWRVEMSFLASDSKLLYYHRITHPSSRIAQARRFTERALH